MNQHFYNILKLIYVIMHQKSNLFVCVLACYVVFVLFCCCGCFAEVCHKEEEREKGVLLSLPTIEGQGRHAVSVIRSESLLGHV